ncbi:Uncharacterised protein [Escherichia coli]|nr:Uncharacterised protein [Escherichia coli]
MQRFPVHRKTLAFMRGLFLVPAVAVPVGVCLVRFGGWRGEVGAPQSAEGCHSASHLAQFSKATDPEKFIKIKIARVGLCRRSRSTKKMQLCAVGEDDFIAPFQLHINFRCSLLNNAFKLERLTTRRRQKNLVTLVRLRHIVTQRHQQCFLCKIPGRSNLSGFQDHPVTYPGFPAKGQGVKPAPLMPLQPADDFFPQCGNLFLREMIFEFFRPAFLSCGRRIRLAIMQFFKLPGQQVYFLKVTACFILFFSKLDEARIDGLRDTLHGWCFIPLVAFFPRINRVRVYSHQT